MPNMLGEGEFQTPKVTPANVGRAFVADSTLVGPGKPNGIPFWAVLRPPKAPSNPKINRARAPKSEPVRSAGGGGEAAGVPGEKCFGRPVPMGGFVLGALIWGPPPLLVVKGKPAEVCRKKAGNCKECSTRTSKVPSRCWQLDSK